MSAQAKSMSISRPSVYMLARIGAGYRSREAAVEDLPMSESTLTRIELGKKKPSAEEIAAMAAVYGRRDLLYLYCRICPICEEIERQKNKTPCRGQIS
ncbi:helix-turn-helix domain-containing protein [Desulfallas thermosapovorans]|uniref:Helix-turn-helix protein n=1 Tax=Desulfallas thermosapovorans DSM 6562 TaxID=1121431 RepID=A0A5S4ZRA6_9FIRM|nr:helix-turn-helix transcriptional regulator [Desulfallas thermosapovorans]TYO95153.1 helix-turn-helix protein [Desulfallas thermosapovorans DSM 6562]